MIGNETDAAYALNMFDAGDDSELLSMDGSTRVTYLIGGIVYKVEIDTDYNNAMEFENMTSIALPMGVYFPDVSLYTINGRDVIAMEYISGQRVAECYCTDMEECESDCAPRDIVALMEDMNLDPCGYNVIINGNGAYIIDAA